MRKIDIRQLRQQNEKKQGEYWAERFEQLEAALHDKSSKKLREIERLYNQALKDIEGKIAIWYQRFADNNQVTPQEAFKLLNSDELQELRWTLREYIRHGRENGLDGRWIKEMENASAKVHIQRLEALQTEVRAELEQVSGKVSEGIEKHIEDIFAESYSRSAFEVQRGTGVGIKMLGVAPHKVKLLVSKPWTVDGRNFSEHLWTNKTKLINSVNNILSKAVMTGNNYAKATDELAKEMKVSKYQAGRVIYTEAAAFGNKAQQQSFKEMNIAKYEILETLDKRTCALCGSYDGQTFPQNQFEIGVTAPPFHPNCRGTIAPYNDGLFDDILKGVGKRAARGEGGKTHYVPGDMKYEDWKKEYMNETA